MTARNEPCPHEHEDGAYVLGALSSEDRAAFERHLPGCQACARSVRDLAGLPGLLARVPVEILDPDEQPIPVPETLLPALVRRVRRSQRRRTWVAGGLVAAAAAVAVGAVGVTTWGDEEPPSASPSATASPQPLQPVGGQPISGWLSLTEVGWGTRLDLTCSYSEEEAEDNPYRVEGPPTYTMYVTRTDGSTEQVASWKALPGRTMHLTAATAADADDIAEVEVRSEGGTTVLELNG
jgi:hypothetical protein